MKRVLILLVAGAVASGIAAWSVSAQTKGKAPSDRTERRAAAPATE